MNAILVIAAIFLYSYHASADTGIEFPENPVSNFVQGTWPNMTSIYAFKFVDTASNGLPYYGTADGGVTLSWEIYPNDPGRDYGYWVTFFMDENDGEFGIGNHAYYGAHPYPWEGPCDGTYGGTSPTHAWEISNGVDTTRDSLFDSAGTCSGENLATNLVEYDKWHYQALTVDRNGTTVTMTFWTDLPSTADADKIEISFTENTGNLPLPTTPDLYFGDAPWAGNPAVTVQHERMNGIFRNLKIWDGLKAESYLTNNAGVDTQLLKSGDADLWYHNPNPTPTDISDKSGATAHDPVWVDTNNKPTLWESATEVPATLIGGVLSGGSFQ